MVGLLGIHVKRTIEGIPLAGYAESLELAKQQSAEAFGGLFDAGIVALPGPGGRSRKG